MTARGKRKKKRRFGESDDSDDSDFEDNNEDSDSDFEPMTRSIARLAVDTNSEPKEPSQSVQNITKKRKLTNNIAQATKKSKETPKSKKETYENSTVICKLKRICKIERIFDEIQDTCRVMKQVQMEAWHVANLHLLRCLQEKKDKIELPNLTQTFFNQCAVGVFGNSVSDPNLNTTLEIYREARSQVNGYIAPSLNHNSLIVGELARQMRVNAQNMIVLHFQRRLTQYLQFHDGMDYQAAKELSHGCCWSKEAYNEDETRIHEWLGFIPTEFNLESNMKQAIRKLYEILQWMEVNRERFQNTRGFRMFTLLPVSTSFVFAHITINASTLRGICARVYEKNKNYPSLQNPLGVPIGKKGGFAHHTYFQKNRENLMRKVFELKGLETKKKGKRKFGYQVTTNGYAASVLLRWLKPKVIEEKKKSTDQEEKKEEEEEEEYQLLPGYSANQIIGIDPGMREFCTAMSEGAIPFVRNERMQRKRDRLLAKIEATPKPKQRRSRKRSKRQVRRNRKKRRRRQRRAQGLLPQRRQRQARELPRRRQRRLPNDIESQC